MRHGLGVDASRGFTLVEVMVALLVIGLLAAGALIKSNQYLEDRYRAEQRFVAQSVAWNPLMEQYLANRGWLPENTQRQTKGRVDQWGRSWYWEMSTLPTLGEQFFRYETTVFELEAGRSEPGTGQVNAGNLFVYWVRE